MKIEFKVGKQREAQFTIGNCGNTAWNSVGIFFSNTILSNITEKLTVSLNTKKYFNIHFSDVLYKICEDFGWKWDGENIIIPVTRKQAMHQAREVVLAMRIIRGFYRLQNNNYSLDTLEHFAKILDYSTPLYLLVMNVKYKTFADFIAYTYSQYSLLHSYEGKEFVDRIVTYNSNCSRNYRTAVHNFSLPTLKKSELWAQLNQFITAYIKKEVSVKDFYKHHIAGTVPKNLNPTRAMCKKPTMTITKNKIYDLEKVSRWVDASKYYCIRNNFGNKINVLKTRFVVV